MRRKWPVGVLTILVWLALAFLAAKAQQCVFDRRTGEWKCAESARPIGETESARPIGGAVTSAVCVVQYRDATGAWTATGTLVGVHSTKDLAHVLTCWHLLRDGGDELICRFPANRTSYRAVIIEQDADADLALLAIRKPAGISPVSVAETAVSVQETVQFGGYSGGRLLFRAGPVIQSRSRWLNVTGTTYSGCSGGPVLNQRGRLVGVCWGNSNGTVYATPWTPVRDFLSRVLPPYYRRVLVPVNPATSTPKPPDSPPLPAVPDTNASQEAPDTPDTSTSPPGVEGCNIAQVEMDLASLAADVSSLERRIDQMASETAPSVNVEISLTEIRQEIEILRTEIAKAAGISRVEVQEEIEALKAEIQAEPVFYVIHRDPDSGEMITQVDPLTGEEHGEQAVHWGDDYTIFLHRGSVLEGPTQ